MKTLALPTLLAACVPMMLLGCADNSDAGDTGDVESAQGGLTMTDEAPQFGDPAAFADATVESDNAVTDPMASTAEVAAMDRDGAAYRAVVLWGQLPPDRSVETATTWTGSFSVNRGARIRPSTSIPLPAAKGITIVTGLAGQLCAEATALSTPTARPTINAVVHRLDHLPMAALPFCGPLARSLFEAVEQRGGKS